MCVNIINKNNIIIIIFLKSLHKHYSCFIDVALVFSFLKSISYCTNIYEKIIKFSFTIFIKFFHSLMNLNLIIYLIDILLNILLNFYIKISYLLEKIII